MARAVQQGRKLKLTLATSKRERERQKAAAQQRKVVWVRNCGRCGGDHEYGKCPPGG